MADSVDVGIGPRLLAIETALRALIEQASATDPALRGRITQAADTYLAAIPPQPELEREFVARARACVTSILRPPAA